MKAIKDITVLIVDHGLFIPVAHRMAESCKRVLYHYPFEQAYRTLNESIIGDGFDDIELCEDIWKVKDEVDLFMFSDILHSGLQLELESQGKLVWGSRRADELETHRDKFLKTLAKVGLPVPEQTTVLGLTKLREYLRDKEDKFIKISKYRGSLETHHWISYDVDEGWIDSLAVEFGPAKDIIKFMVFDPIEAAIENGCDTICVDGQWPSLVLNGAESKDKSYLAAVTPRGDMPDNVKAVLDAFSPVFKAERYRNEFSMEMRGDYFIDCTSRGGLPSTGSQLNIWGNFPEMVYHGAMGDLVEPKAIAKFACECILSMKTKKGEWGKVRVPKELTEWVKLGWCCEIDGAICFPPDLQHGEDIGWLTSLGDTAQEAIENMHKYAAMLPDGLNAATGELVGLMENIHAGEKDGIEFSDNEVPDPLDAVMLEN